ncbi:MAG: 16S rRNA processing protein RimM [Candidatus Azotimanducaceae bacterium]|jgi:16S rRNA processing protein RimM
MTSSIEGDETSAEKHEPERIAVGRINGVYGIKGWVKIYSYTDPIEQILAYKPWYLLRQNQRFTPSSSQTGRDSKNGSLDRTLEIEAGKVHGKGIIALPDGFKDRNEAESLKGFEIWVDRALLPKLEGGDYYWHQLENLQVVNEQGECLGHISHLLETGANDVLVVNPGADSIDDLERLIPYVEGSVVIDIDLATSKMRVDWPADY